LKLEQEIAELRNSKAKYQKLVAGIIALMIIVTLYQMRTSPEIKGIVETMFILVCLQFGYFQFVTSETDKKIDRILVLIEQLGK